MGHINVEFKAKCTNLEKIRTLLLSNNATFIGKDIQIDTYFNVDSGRLKLREGSIETALIHYDRQNQKGPKRSDVILYHPKETNTRNLKEILRKILGIKIIVEKEREIYFISNVKFHIDTVKELGSFIEVEAIDKDGTIDKNKLLEQCNYYLNLFNISNNDLIPHSYSDLILDLKTN